MAIAALIIVSDQLSKEWIRTNIPLGGATDEVFRISLVHFSNTGAVFGLFADRSLILSIVAILGIILILVFYRQFRLNGIQSEIALGLILGGAVGNLIDRIRLGHVTDFIYAHLWGDFYWPAFNVADASISIGIITLMIFIFITMKKKDEETAKS